MATDPTTGQTILTPRFDQAYAGFLDPTQFGQIAAGQSQAGLLGSLGQQLLQAGYVPNSGSKGAISQMIQALAGGLMLKRSQDQIAGLSQQQAQAMNDAEVKKHAQEQADLKTKTDELIRQAGGSKAAELAAASSPAQTAADAARLAALSGPEATAAGAKAAAEATAKLPGEKELEQMRAASAANVAGIGANATKGRAYQVQDAAGNTKMVALQPDGSFKEVYSTPSAGGGKLTPTQTALNEADVTALKNYTTRTAAAEQLTNNLPNFVSKYTGLDPAAVAQMTPQQQADAIRKVPVTQVANAAINPNYSGLDAIGNDIGINAAGTKRPDPTEAIVAAEQKNTLSRYKTPEANATILLNHYSDIANLAKERASVVDKISSRQAPNAGAVPAAVAGPQNQASVPPLGAAGAVPAQASSAPQGVHYIFDPKSGQLVPAQQ